MRASQAPPLNDGLSADDLRDLWMILSSDERLLGFKMLGRSEAEEFFLELSARDHSELLLALPQEEQRSWIRLLPPDDAADLVQELKPEERDRVLGL